MAKTLIGSLEVRLIDRLSPAAKQAASALGGLRSAGDALGSGAGKLDALSAGLRRATADAKALADATKGAGWGRAFDLQLARMRAAPDDVARLRSEWAKLQDQLKDARANKGDVGGIRSQMALWRSQALQEIAAVRQVQSAAERLRTAEVEAEARKRAKAEADAARARSDALREAAREQVRQARQANREAAQAEREAARESVRAAREAAQEKAQAAREAARAQRQAAQEAVATARHAAREEAAARRAQRDAERRDRDRPSLVPLAMRPGNIVRSGATALGVGGAAVTVNRTGRNALSAGADALRENLRIEGQGATPDEAERMHRTARDLSQRYQSLDVTQIREMGRNLLANVGDYDKAMEVLPQYVRGRVALQTILGPRADDKEMEHFSRFIDIAGRSRNVGSTQFLIDRFIRSRQVDSRATAAQDYVNMMQTAGSAGRGFSDQFLGNVVPALISQQRGHRTGTDLMTAFQNFAMGRGTNATLEQQMDFFRGGSDSNLAKQDRMGLREGITRDRQGRMTNRGQLVDEGLYLSNPYEWAKKHLVPRLVQEGALPEGYARGDYSQELNTEQRGKLTRRLNDLFSARRGSSLFSLLLGDMGQIEAIMERIEKARGTRDVEGTAARDPHVQWEALQAQFRNLLMEASGPIMRDLLPAVQSFAAQINDLSQQLAKAPEMVTAKARELAGVIGGVAIALAGLKVANMVSMAAAGPALIFASGSLARSAAALTFAAGALSRRGLPDLPGSIRNPTGPGSAATTAGGVAAGGAASRVMMRFVPGLGWVAVGAAGYVAGQAINEVSEIAQGKHWTPRDEDETEGYRQRIAELKGRLEGIDSRTHPSMRGAPNPERANLEGQIADLENRVRAGEERQRARDPGGMLGPEAGHSAGQVLQGAGDGAAGIGSQTGAAFGQGMQQAIAAATPGITAEIDRIMAEARARVGGGIDLPIRVTTAGQPPSPAPAAPARASGGSVYAGQIYRVNEHRTEFFRPATDGHIDPQGGGGGIALGGGASVNLGGIHVAKGQNVDVGQIYNEVMQRLKEEVWEGLSAALSDTEYANG